MHDFSANYLKFWSTMFGYTTADLTAPGFSIVSNGYYVEKHQDKYVFFYKDLLTTKRILACSPVNLAALTKTVAGENFADLDLDSISEVPFIKNQTLAFNDIDYCILKASDFKPAENNVFEIKPLLENQTSELEEFYSDCSEDDRDTLDLTFENEIVLGIYLQNQLMGIARAASIRDTGISDITVLVRTSGRGKGYSTPLVSQLVREILKSGLQPKYRVAETNHASIAIANRLGFKPLVRLLTWEVTT